MKKLLSRLTRFTTTGNVIPQIDGLRFVAIATVVVFHLGGFLRVHAPLNWTESTCSSVTERLAATGHYGVELFFAISGFILALPFAKHHLLGARRPTLGAYFKRRLTRLEPPYIANLLLFFVLQIKVKGISLWTHLADLAASLAYQHGLIYGQASRVNGVAWSLEVEVQFYILAPFLTYVFAVRRAWLRRVVLLGIWFVAIAFKWQVVSRLPGGGVSPRLTLSLPYFLEFFWAGFILAEFYVAERWEQAGKARLWDLVTVVGWPLLLWVWLSSAVTPIAFPLLVPLLYAAALRGTSSSKVFGNGWAAAVGGMCYTLYLFHYLVISAVGRFTRSLWMDVSFGANFALQFVLIVPVVLAVGTAMYLLIERPCMRPDWPQRLAAWVRRHRAAAAGGAPGGQDG